MRVRSRFATASPAIGHWEEKQLNPGRFAQRLLKSAVFRLQLLQTDDIRHHESKLLR
jgi:hypothetical protein